MSYGTVLLALADPTRRSILERLRAGELTAGEVGRGLPMSQPAVSKHLRILREAGLVRERRAGTRRIYALDQDGLAELRTWIEAFWDEPLAAFQRSAETTNERNDR
jgi:DNA-binding transcriptional ArsR family regulator